jgi:hypothetical protein
MVPYSIAVNPAQAQLEAEIDSIGDDYGTSRERLLAIRKD